MTAPPREPPDGQDETPGFRAVVAAILSLLDDLRLFLRTHRDDPAAGELLLRVEAHRSALGRLRHHLGGRP